MFVEKIGLCPRCERELVRGSTPTGKICFRCPSCGGVAVTLPALREALDAKSIAVLTQAAHAAEYAGCLCPGCGRRMSLLKVGNGNGKLEIDVCGRCLTIWCDKGEYETLVPPLLPESHNETMRQLLERTSLETRERFATILLESQPEDVSPDDFDIGDILRDVARLVIGAPTFWRKVRPVSPFFTIVLALALPIAQAFIFYCCNDLETLHISSRGRDFWILTASMAHKCGFDLSAPLTAFSFPFVQVSGLTAVLHSILLFVPLAVVERRIGCFKFIGLFCAFVVTSIVAQIVSTATGWTSGRLCGIVPVAFGFLSYLSFAWPDLRIKGSFGLLGIYVVIVALFVLLFPLLSAAAYDFISFGVVPIATCSMLGAFLGSHSRQSRLRPNQNM